MWFDQLCDIDCNVLDKQALMDFIHSDSKISEEIYPKKILMKRNFGSGVEGLFFTPEDMTDQDPSLLFAYVRDHQLRALNLSLFTNAPLAKETFGPGVWRFELEQELSHQFFLFIKDALFSPAFDGRKLQSNVSICNLFDFPLDRILNDPDWIFDPQIAHTCTERMEFSSGEMLDYIQNPEKIQPLFHTLRQMVLDGDFDHRRSGLRHYLSYMVMLKHYADAVREEVGGRVEESLRMRDEIVNQIPVNAKAVTICYENDHAQFEVTVSNPRQALFPSAAGKQPPIFLGINVDLLSPNPPSIQIGRNCVIPWSKITCIKHRNKPIWERH